MSVTESAKFVVTVNVNDFEKSRARKTGEVKSRFQEDQADLCGFEADKFVCIFGAMAVCP